MDKSSLLVSSSSHPPQLHTSQVEWDRKCQMLQENLAFGNPAAATTSPFLLNIKLEKKDKGGEKRGFGAASVSFSQGDTDGAVLLLQGQRKNCRAAGGLEGREEVGVGAELLRDWKSDWH